MGISLSTSTVEHTTYYWRITMKLCLILIIAILALSTEAASNEDKQEVSGSDKPEEEVSGTDKPQEEMENGYFGYGYGAPYRGGGRGGVRYGAYSPVRPAYGYGYGGGNRQIDCCNWCPWCWCCGGDDSLNRFVH